MEVLEEGMSRLAFLRERLEKKVVQARKERKRGIVSRNLKKGKKERAESGSSRSRDSTR